MKISVEDFVRIMKENGNLSDEEVTKKIATEYKLKCNISDLRDLVDITRAALPAREKHQ